MEPVGAGGACAPAWLLQLGHVPALQVNPALYCAFRMPGGVEYDGGKALLYGPKSDDVPPEISLKPGQRCPGFPFNAHREYACGARCVLGCSDAVDQGGQQPEQLEQVQELCIQVLGHP